MESASTLIKIVLYYICICFFVNCHKENKPNKIVYNTSQLQHGDIIYRLGNTYYSSYFRDFSKRDRKYSHTGIVVKYSENDSIYVIHAEADDHTGIGEVRKESIASFLKDAMDWGVYRWHCSGLIKQDFVTWASHYHQLKIPFDMAFDCSDSSAFYCTELVAHCINNAFKKEIIRANTIHNSKPFIALDDTYLIDSIEFIDIKF
jgi:Permuted papain-like amidase enzyme, YaeF/YiiX, C92 family